MRSSQPSRRPVAPTFAFRGGALLAELIVSMAISGILITGIVSAVAISLKSSPGSQSSAMLMLQANRSVDQLATELETAIHVTERSATVIGFTVPDRNGDGVAERIRYAWTGTPGGALARQYNGATPVALAASVDLFNLTPTYKTVAETYPGTGVEDASESLLIDCFGTSGTSNNDVKSANWYGQHFTLTLPANAHGWRPTRVRFMARKGSFFGFTRVQMRPPIGTLVPSDTILEQHLLLEGAMETNYTWQSFDFSSLDPLPSGGAICLVLQHLFGSTTATLQSSSACPGQLKTSNGGSTWSYDSGKCLVSQLYGKLTRASGSQTLNSNYLTSMNIVLRATSSSPAVNTITPFLNHPELLSGKWELNFDKNPTTVDVNGDGAGDWVVNGGVAFNMTSLVNGVWRTSGTQLNTTPNNDFAKSTVVDVKFQNTSVGGNGATFTINALRSGSSCAPILVYLAKQSDGTQTLKLSTKPADFITQTRMTIAGLPNQPVSLRLIINPASSSVSLRVNDVERGTYSLTPFVSTDGNRYAAIGSSGSNSEFSYVRIRVLEQ